VRPFDDLFGNPAQSTHLPEGDMRRVMRRAQRMAQRGSQSNGAHADMAEIRAGAADQAELAREISEALQSRDVVRAQALIREGAALFGHAAMVRAVEAQASQDRQFPEIRPNRAAARHHVTHPCF
jgi:hypothetical protein